MQDDLNEVLDALRKDFPDLTVHIVRVINVLNALSVLLAEILLFSICKRWKMKIIVNFISLIHLFSFVQIISSYSCYA